MAKSDWREINVELELSEQRRAQYQHAKDLYKQYKVARDAFEQGMNSDAESMLSEDEELKFGYNFGKLSVAVGEKRERKPKREAKPTQSFGDWLKAQREGGHNH